MGRRRTQRVQVTIGDSVVVGLVTLYSSTPGSFGRPGRPDRAFAAGIQTPYCCSDACSTAHALSAAPSLSSLHTQGGRYELSQLHHAQHCDQQQCWAATWY